MPEGTHFSNKASAAATFKGKETQMSQSHLSSLCTKAQISRTENSEGIANLEQNANTFSNN